MTVFKTFVMTACAATLFSSTPVLAESAKPSPFTAEQQGALEDVIRDFILDNPEVLMEAVNRYKANEEKRQDEDARASLDKYRDFIFKNPEMPQAGNPKGDFTVVEFFDYNCGYCKRAYEAVQETIDKDKNVRFVFVELPILSDQSRTAAQWAMAAQKQGKYFEFHKALMTYSGPKSEEAMTDIAKKIGLNIEKLKKDATSQETQDLLSKKMEVAQAMKIQGTPAFVVGNEIVRGYLPYDAMKTVIASQREANKAQ